MQWPWARPSAPQPVAFDVLIDLRAHPGGPGLERAVRDAVRGMPGAVWIDVQTHAQLSAEAVRVFPAGSSQVPQGPAWEGLHAEIAGVVARVVAARPPPGPAWSPAPMPNEPGRGMAEAMAPNQLDALAQLAALAQSTRALPPPRPAPAGGDVDRLAALLDFVLPADARATATTAIARLGSFAAVLAAPETELRRIPGLGTHSVAAIKLVHAAAIRLARARAAERPVLDDPDRLAAYLATALARERIEQFRILFLDAAGMLRADEVQATGTVNHTPVYPREVVRRALELGAASVVLVHNHPSGDPEPSREDIEMTRRVQAAARTMDVAVRDHVIVGNGSWLSFRDAGLLH